MAIGWPMAIKTQPCAISLQAGYLPTGTGAPQSCGIAGHAAFIITGLPISVASFTSLSCPLRTS